MSKIREAYNVLLLKSVEMHNHFRVKFTLTAKGDLKIIIVKIYRENLSNNKVLIVNFYFFTITVTINAKKRY